MKKFFKKIMDFMFSTPITEGEYKIVITEEHVAGNKHQSNDCPGFRAFKDALPKNVYLKIPTIYRHWAVTNNNTCWEKRTNWNNDNNRWVSYRKNLSGSYKKNSNGELVVFSMMRAEVGDEVVFKKI